MKKKGERVSIYFLSLSLSLRFLCLRAMSTEQDARLFKRSYQVVWNIIKDNCKNPADREVLWEAVRKMQRKRMVTGDLALQNVHPCILQWLQLYVTARVRDWPEMQRSFAALEPMASSPPLMHVRPPLVCALSSSLDGYLLAPTMRRHDSIEARLSSVFIRCSKAAEEGGFMLRMPVQQSLDEFEFVAVAKVDTVEKSVAILVNTMPRAATLVLYRLFVLSRGVRRHVDSYHSLNELVVQFSACCLV